MLFYHWLRENGQPVKDISILNDFSEDTNYYYNLEKANYVEYPDYVTNITGRHSVGQRYAARLLDEQYDHIRVQQYEFG